MTIAHTTFTIERSLPGVPQRAFRFFADPELKRRWTSCHPDWQMVDARFDFRVGGGERSLLRAPDGVLHELQAHYLDIVESERIVYAFWMSVAGVRISASLATVEFEPAGSATRLVFTEQVAVLDYSVDMTMREQGTGTGLARLAAVLEDELRLSALSDGD